MVLLLLAALESRQLHHVTVTPVCFAVAAVTHFSHKHKFLCVTAHNTTALQIAHAQTSTHTQTHTHVDFSDAQCHAEII